MNDYNNGYRHVTLFGETEEQKQELNNILDEKGYVYEENTDGIAVVVKETIGKNENFRNLMSRVSDDDRKAYELYLNELSYEMLKPNVQNVNAMVDVVSEGKKELIDIMNATDNIINQTHI